jgi:hypothetical protein
MMKYFTGKSGCPAAADISFDRSSRLWLSDRMEKSMVLITGEGLAA